MLKCCLYQLEWFLEEFPSLMEGGNRLEIIELLNTVNTTLDLFGGMVELVKEENLKVGVFLFGCVSLSPLKKEKN